MISALMYMILMGWAFIRLFIAMVLVPNPKTQPVTALFIASFFAKTIAAMIHRRLT